MTNEWMDKPELKGPVMGLLAGLNILAEVMVATKIIDQQALGKLFQEKVRELRLADDEAATDAATVLDLLARPFADETRIATRKLLNDETEGQA